MLKVFFNYSFLITRLNKSDLFLKELLGKFPDQKLSKYLRTADDRDINVFDKVLELTKKNGNY